MAEAALVGSDSIWGASYVAGDRSISSDCIVRGGGGLRWSLGYGVENRISASYNRLI